MFPIKGLSSPCPAGMAGMCSRMGLADGANMTSPGVSFVPVGWTNPCTLDSVRPYTYFPSSWSNQSVAAVYPGYVNVFGYSQYHGKVR